jgi:iron complex transport system ATP-binding protein
MSIAKQGNEHTYQHNDNFVGLPICDLSFIQVQNLSNMIVLKNLSVGYGSGNSRKAILEGLNLTFNQSELTGIVGNNGVGKSSLLRTLDGSLKPMAGDLTIEGRAIQDLELNDLAKKVAIVLTDKVGGFNLSVFTVLASGRLPFLGSLAALGKADIAIIENTMERLEIRELRDVLMDELSDGQRQKVMIAKALVQETPVILLDEPSAFLDYTSKNKLFLTLRELCQTEKKCVVVSSHDLELLFRYADKLLHLRGRTDFSLDSPDNIRKLLLQNEVV